MPSVGKVDVPGTGDMAGVTADLECAFLAFFHQRGVMTRTPSASPHAKAARTTITNGADHSVPKKKLTATAC